jgi:AbrB family looped-hinge helix DNA binding protein
MCKKVRIEIFINNIILQSYMVNITKVSSKGQIVIPAEIRERMGFEEGNLLIISDNNDSICMKKIELPKIKSWKKSTKPFREAAKKSNFSNDELKKLIEESRIR